MLVEAIDKTVNKDLPSDHRRFSFLRLKEETLNTEGHPTQETQLGVLLHAAMVRLAHGAENLDYAGFSSLDVYRSAFLCWIDFQTVFWP